MDNRFVVLWPWLASLRSYLVVADLLAFVAAALVVGPQGGVAAGVLAAAGGLATCLVADAHRVRLALTVRPDLARLAAGAVVATVVLVAVGPLSATDSASWASITLYAVCAAGLLVALRSGVYAVVRAARRTGRTARPVVVVGAGALGRRVVDALVADRGLGLVPIGTITDSGDSTRSATRSLPVLGDLDSLSWAMVDLGVHDVVFAFPEPPGRAGIEAVNRSLRHGHRVFVVPQFFELTDRDRTRGVERLGAVDLLHLADWGLRPQERAARRVVDAVTAAASLVVLAPLLLGIAAAILVEMRGSSVLLRRARTGRGGRAYTQLRFRTLRTPVFATGTTVWRIDNDSRIGPVGRLLRGTRLDELPRLINVLAGDLTFFSTRSDRPAFVGEFPRELLVHEEVVLIGPGVPPPVAGTRERARALK